MDNNKKQSVGDARLLLWWKVNEAFSKYKKSLTRIFGEAIPESVIDTFEDNLNEAAQEYNDKVQTALEHVINDIQEAEEYVETDLKTETSTDSDVKTSGEDAHIELNLNDFVKQEEQNVDFNMGETSEEPIYLEIGPGKVTVTSGERKNTDSQDEQIINQHQDIDTKQNQEEKATPDVTVATENEIQLTDQVTVEIPEIIQEANVGGFEQYETTEENGQLVIYIAVPQDGNIEEDVMEYEYTEEHNKNIQTEIAEITTDDKQVKTESIASKAFGAQATYEQCEREEAKTILIGADDGSGLPPQEVKSYMVKSLLDKLDLRSKLSKTKDDDEDENTPDLDEASLKKLTANVNGFEFDIAPRVKKRMHRMGKLVKEGDLPCDVCGKLCVTQAALTRHKNREHPEKSEHECSYCYEIFTNAKNLNKHFYHAHFLGPRCYCPSCQAPFKKHEEFKAHLCDCDFTPEQFGYKRPIIERKKIEVKGADLPFKCAFCQSGFIRQGLLTFHIIRRHLKYTPGCKFGCEICELRFLDEYSLLKHTRGKKHQRKLDAKHGKSGTDEPLATGAYGFTNLTRKPREYKKGDLKKAGGKKVHICEICGKEFNQPSSLYIHRTRHYRAWKCEICGYGATSRPQLKVHMRVHTGETPYLCDTCGKAFRGKRHLNAHVHTMHNNNLAFRCVDCGSIFKHSRNLEAHVKKKHGDEALDRFRQIGNKGMVVHIEPNSP